MKERSRPAVLVPGVQLEGDTIAGRYRIEAVIGTGGSGVVVAARHVYLHTRATLKLLPATSKAQEEAQRRHLAAAHRAAALRGPHVARVIDTGFAEDGAAYIATEHLEGRSFAAELAARKQIPIQEAVRWLLQACEGLAEAHAAGLVHGNLKPSNLFLAGETLKLLDLGMGTQALAAEAGSSSPWFASPAYLAPEQIRDPNAIDARTDIWALGILLYEAIAGTLPFAADTVSGMLVAVAYDEPAMLAAQATPFALARVVKACLAKDPAARPTDVAALARQLAPFAGADGPGLVHEIEATLSRPPPPVTIDGDDDAALGPSDAPQPESDGADALLLKRPLAREKQRRAVAMATAGAAAVLAIVALARSPSPAPSPAPAAAAPTPEPVTTIADPAEPAVELVTAPPAASPAAPAPPPPPKPRAEPPPSRRPPVPPNVAPPRVGPKQPPNARASLSVREDPYVRPAPPARIPERPK